MRLRQLSESELVQARQYLVRNWSVPAAGDFSEASRLLGISRNTLKARLRLYGL